jgi:transposase
MLKNTYEVELTPFDHQVFETFVPANHYLRQLKAAIDFTPIRGLVADCYSPDQGRGAIDPIFLIKLSLLQFQYDLSDDGVLRQAQVDTAFRYFLDWPAHRALPEPSLLSQFRKRLSADRFTKIFNEILRQARANGLVKDRLRLKDATHLIANIAVPSTIRLVAQTREQLLSAAEAFAPEQVAQYRQEALEIRRTTADLKDNARLLARVNQLRALVEWATDWHERLDQGTTSASAEVHQSFVAALALARKVIGDRKPKAKDQLRALTDTDVRRSYHCEYYDGYLLDLSVDADSGLICALDVLPANADEAANAKNLIESEEAAHGNDIESLSMDSIGYNGPALKALSDEADGPQLQVFVPPKPDWSATPELYQPADFKLNEAGDELTCPDGKTTRSRHRDGKNHGWVYNFKASLCETRPLRANCIKANKRGGRQVSKNDFQPQYQAAKERATSEEYKQVRKEHPAVERKLGELVRWHNGRRVRYRGRLRVKVQYLLLGIVANCKRFLRLLTTAPVAQPA